MKKLTFLLIAFISMSLLPTIGKAQEKVSLTFKFKTINTIAGYDHVSKLKVFCDNELVGESSQKLQSIANSVTVKVPKGVHHINAALYALYQGKWESRTIEHNYSFDFEYDKTGNWSTNNTINLTFDIESESATATEKIPIDSDDEKKSKVKELTTTSDIPTGEVIYKEDDKVKIEDIYPEDSYYSDRSRFIGKNATVISVSYNKSNSSYSGKVKMETGETAYFYSIMLSRITDDRNQTSKVRKQATTPDNPTNEVIYKENDKVKIEDIYPEDSYYSDRSRFIGKNATVISVTYNKSNSSYSGKVKMETGETAYFYSIMLSRITDDRNQTSKVRKQATTPDNPTGEVIYEEGDKVKIEDIYPADSYYSDRSIYVGKNATVISVRYNKSNLSYSGEVKMETGETVYFYSIMLSRIAD
ncbi:hypothetical protein ACQ33O_09410 [Ferruginibacter sp. SUN002]|uniref:hypothetical protein n=1 Tax=Ferruginibacter sp. SUN002 TaxID=2937789 RepID=UPI003D35B63A